MLMDLTRIITGMAACCRKAKSRAARLWAVELEERRDDVGLLDLVTNEWPEAWRSVTVRTASGFFFFSRRYYLTQLLPQAYRDVSGLSVNNNLLAATYPQ